MKYAKYNVGGFDYGAEADYTNFRITTADMTQGQRVMFNPYLSYSVVGPGYFVTPKVQWHFASYNLNNIGYHAGTPKNFTESIPTLTFDTGLIFDRSVRIFGEDYIQTLEPRLYYVYTPYRNQENAPLFDTADSDFGLAEFFTPNTFVGNDRIADANRLTAAITTRFIDPGDGRRTRALRDRAAVLLPRSARYAAAYADQHAGHAFGPDRGCVAQARRRFRFGNGVPI